MGHNRSSITRAPASLRIIVLAITVHFSWGACAQRLIAEKIFDDTAYALPCDYPLVYPAGNNAFVMLRMSETGIMELSLTDDGLEVLWQTKILPDSTITAPRMFLSGDMAVVYTFTVFEDTRTARLSFTYCNLLTGKPVGSDEFSFNFSSASQSPPRILFSQNHSKFMVYGYVPEGENEVAFDVFSFGKKEIFAQHRLPQKAFPPGSSKNVFLHEDGSLFVAVADLIDEKLKTYFVRPKQQWTTIARGIFKDRLVESVGNIHIVRQGASTFFVAVPTKIGDELTGIFTVGVNVVFKNILYAQHNDLLGDDISEMYGNAYDLRLGESDDAPHTLADFNLVQAVTDDNKAVVLIFEQAGKTLPSSGAANLPDDENHNGRDLLLLGFSPGGMREWHFVIRKTQHDRPDAASPSYLFMKKGHFMRIAFQPHSGAGTVHVADVDMDDGRLVAEALFLPPRSFDFVRKYSCWLNNQNMLVGGTTHAGLPKQIIMTVEF